MKMLPAHALAVSALSGLYLLSPMALPAAPGIAITSIPTYLSDENLAGIVTDAAPTEHHVAVYIKVGVWWTKPTFDNPTVPINSDGTWTADVNTGEADNQATAFVAVLLRRGDEPPPASGSVDLPAGLEAVELSRDVKIRLQFRRTLEFSGRIWGVKESTIPVGPGPNLFSADARDVWTDQDGLHLNLENRQDQWHSTEVILTEHLGYGIYAFTTTSRLDDLDPYLVAGFFTWDDYGDDDDACPFQEGGMTKTWPYREIDFEFSTWNNAHGGNNAQYVVQPFQVEGNLLRYRLDPTEATPELTLIWVWTPEKIQFITLRGSRNPACLNVENIVQMWTYRGPCIPDPGRENIRINFWLINGHAPENGLPDELVVKDFQFLKLDSAAGVSGAGLYP